MLQSILQLREGASKSKKSLREWKASKARQHRNGPRSESFDCAPATNG